MSNSRDEKFIVAVRVRPVSKSEKATGKFSLSKIMIVISSI